MISPGPLEIYPAPSFIYLTTHAMSRERKTTTLVQKRNARTLPEKRSRRSYILPSQKKRKKEVFSKTSPDIIYCNLQDASSKLTAESPWPSFLPSFLLFFSKETIIEIRQSLAPRHNSCRWLQYTTDRTVLAG